MRAKNPGNSERKHNAREREWMAQNTRTGENVLNMYMLSAHDSGGKRHGISEAGNCNPNTQKVEYDRGLL